MKEKLFLSSKTQIEDGNISPSVDLVAHAVSAIGYTHWDHREIVAKALKIDPNELNDKFFTEVDAVFKLVTDNGATTLDFSADDTESIEAMREKIENFRSSVNKFASNFIDTLDVVEENIKQRDLILKDAKSEVRSESSTNSED